MASDWFLLYIHIMEDLLCAQLLALDCLMLTPFVTIFQLWGHWCPANKSSWTFISKLSHSWEV